MSENHRYLVDAEGRPFPVSGGSPWELAWQLTREEAEKPLEDRRLKGFNAILVDAIPYTDWSDHLTQTTR